MVPLNEKCGEGPGQPPPRLTEEGLTISFTSVTKAEGGATMAIWERSPVALVTLAATQHISLPPGFWICHQPPSALLPRIWALLPTASPVPMLSNSLAGAKR